jgi:hypothetical protein
MGVSCAVGPQQRALDCPPPAVRRLCPAQRQVGVAFPTRTQSAAFHTPAGSRFQLACLIQDARSYPGIAWPALIRRIIKNVLTR